MFRVQQVQLIVLTLHITQEVIGRHVAALRLLVIFISDERGRGVQQHCVTPRVTLAAVQPRLAAQTWGHILEVETVHEWQAAGAALAHAVVEVGAWHQARATVDDP